MKHLLITLLITLNLVSCSQKQPNYANIQETVESFAANKLLNGSIIVANKDSIIYKGSFGYSNFKTKIEINSSSNFPIASLTKQFTATAIMMLHEREQLSIDDEISAYIDVPPIMQGLRIKNLLNHTSGLPDYWSNSIENNNDSIWKYIFQVDSLLFAPNTDFSYSNSGYFLLGQIIEVVSKVAYGEYLQENIFKPLGMNSTYLYDGNNYSGAIGYKTDWKIDEYFATTADGGIISTIDDLLIWDTSLSLNKLISVENRNIMFKPTELENGENSKYGFGWEVGLSEMSLFDHLSGKYKNIVSHTGGLSSFGAYNQFDTKNDVYVILLSNQLRLELMDLINEINSDLY